MPEVVPPQKEVTVRILCGEIEDRLGALEAMLKEHFNRDCAVEKPAVEKPQCPNILDGIIGSLMESSTRVDKLHHLLNESVIQKLY
jgi:hypothetical protein